jgi:hypothetical protein
MRYRNQLVYITLVLGLIFLAPWKAIGDGATSIAKTIAATQSGTWTVQPGNTANTTAWLFKLDQTSTNNDVDIATLPNEGQQTMANSISVALASDITVPDPCTFRAKTYVPINSSTAATTQLVAASASNKLYVCSLHMITNAANNVAFVEDDTSACASPTAGIIGGTTSGTGYILAANGGLTLGSGNGTVGVTAATNRYVCLITSAATQLSGGLSYVLAP